jgi:hypothetical protein
MIFMLKQAMCCSGLALATFASNAFAGTIIVNDAGDTGPGNCATTCTLRDAIASAIADDTVQFQPGLASPITLTQGELLIDKALTIQGPGAAALTISAGNASRVFKIAANVSIAGLTIADGKLIGSKGSAGAAGEGDSAPGGDGGPGESVGGACILIANGATVVVDHAFVHHCVATGGTGGTGGFGAPGTGGFGGHGGLGGSGGTATGGAIRVAGSLNLLYSSVIDPHARGGNGGAGGMGNPTGLPPGMGGAGGAAGAAKGGAIAVDAGGSLRIANSTIAGSDSNGGVGGDGGMGDGNGSGGNGGDATGGLVYVDGTAALADLEFSTLVNGAVTAGPGGSSQPGFGPAGVQNGSAIHAASTLNVISSIVVGAQSDVDLCNGSISVAAGSVNLSEDASCGFSLQASFAQVLKPLDTSATPAYQPIWQSPAIDAATSCQDLASQSVAADQHDTPRPQGAVCDLGAIEADYILVDGFGG